MSEELSASTTQWPSVTELLGKDAARGDRPWLRMISAMTLSGSTTIDDTSGALGNELDGKLLLALRQWSDAVLVTSSTVKREQYGPVSPTDDRPEPPALVVVSPHLSLSPSSPAVTDAVTPTIVVCPGSDLSDPELKDRARALGDAGAVVLTAAPGAQGIIDALSARGYSRLSLEGGPSLYSQFLADDVVDEAYLTLDPSLTASVPTPLVKAGGDSDAAALPFRLVDAHVCPDSVVFLRYAREREQ